MKRIVSLFTFLWKYLLILAGYIFSTLKKIFLFIHRRKFLAIPFYAFIAFIIYITALIQFSGDSSYSKTLTNKRINDVTQLNPIHINKEIRPESVEEIINSIQSTTGPISIGGGKFSMGGQTAFENSLHIDMRSFKKVIDLDTVNKQVTVQPGITWRELQEVIDPYNLSIKIMQTYANFTVGGSISVNCHGRYIGHGPIISSVLEIKLVLASGELITANRVENAEIFNAAVGGYGGIGVIVEAKLQLTENVKVARYVSRMPADNYNEFFNNEIKNNEKVIFQNGDLYPPDFDQIINISWQETDKALTDENRVSPADQSYWLEHQLMKVVSWGDGGKWFRKKIIDPAIYNSEKVVWRNNEASYDVAELEPASRDKSTYVLQEYFIPVQNIKSFIPKMKGIFDKYDVNVINVSLRHALPDKASYLSWAREEVFAFVIYYKQETTEEAKEEVKKWTIEMTDAILSEKGRWYLPYQPHATTNQFFAAYPDATKYFQVKNAVDSTHRFTNKLIDKYNPFLKDKIGHKKNTIDGYLRAEEQTVLTVPEWYLVFNPKEYADYLEQGNDPSDFPFYKSIDEYWRLYDRSLKLVENAYPENGEYKTMLQVIGVSVTMEYGVKILYENTVGSFFSLFAEDKISNEEQIIIDAQRAYSDFIYHTAWYEFEFLPWVGKVWANREATEGSFLRKWERTLFFTMEFSFKALYAQLIEWAAKATYEPPVTKIYAIVSSTDSLLQSEDVVTAIDLGNEKIIGITRWGAFTTTLLDLASQNISIHEISGNDEIVISVIINKGQTISFEHADLLYESRIVTEENLVRYVYLIPTNELMPFIRLMLEEEIIVEHIFDY